MFESFLVPLVIAGRLAALIVSGAGFGVYGPIRLHLLIRRLAENAILVVDFADTRRREAPRRAAASGSSSWWGGVGATAVTLFLVPGLYALSARIAGEPGRRGRALDEALAQGDRVKTIA